MAVHILHPEVAIILQNLQVREFEVDDLLMNQLVKTSKLLNKADRVKSEAKFEVKPEA